MKRSAADLPPARVRYEAQGHRVADERYVAAQDVAAGRPGVP